MRRRRVTLLLFFALALCVLTPLLWNWERGGEYRTFDSPDHRYKVVVVRARTFLPLMPFQSYDAGWVEIYDVQREQLIARKRVKVVQDVDQVDWSSTNVYITFVGEWPLP
jgi:hypothetical protein